MPTSSAAVAAASIFLLALCSSSAAFRLVIDVQSNTTSDSSNATQNVNLNCGWPPPLPSTVRAVMRTGQVATFDLPINASKGEYCETLLAAKGVLLGYGDRYGVDARWCRGRCLVKVVNGDTVAWWDPRSLAWVPVGLLL